MRYCTDSWYGKESCHVSGTFLLGWLMNWSSIAQGRAMPKKALGACQKTLGKLWLAPPEGISWAYNFLVIVSDSSSKIIIAGRGQQMEGHTMDQRVCQIKHFVRYPL
jgi:hypothetical protein